MGINVFLSSLLLVAAGTYFIPVKNLSKSDEDKDIPLVVFDKPQMYTLTENSLNRVVEASHVIRYKNRDEMLNANIALKNKDENKNFDTEILKAKRLIKKDDIFTLKNEVVYQRDDFISIRTDELYYNLKTKVAYNNLPYEGKYYNHILKGDKLYLDVAKNSMKSNNVHFEIDMKK